MLELILGRAGSGKTEYLRGLLQESRAEKTILLVPEQSSFQNERAMLRRLGARDARRVEVLSFSRLAERAFQEYGGAAGRRLDDGGRAVLMSLALEESRDQLEFYRKSADSTELIGMLLGVSAELKMCEILPQTLANSAREERAAALPSALRQKMQELAVVLSVYDALVGQSYIDPQDSLTRLAALLREHSLFEGAMVAVDAFQSFTVQEYHILHYALKQADRVCVALCADKLDDPERGMGLFSLVRRTASNLIRMAREENVAVAAPVTMEPGKRFQSPGLAALEAGAYRAAREEAGEADGVSVYEARDLYDEAEYTAASIRYLIMEEGYRYRDIAVIARTPENYSGILEASLEHRDIPYFMDEPQRTDAEPLMRMVLSAFHAVKSSFASDHLFLYLKTGLAGFETEELSLLENYTFLWDITGAKWKEVWKDHPRGFVEEWRKEDCAALETLEALRVRVMEPLQCFSRSLENADGVQQAGAVYHLLEQTGAARGVRALAKRLTASGRPELAERQLRLWDIMMEILDQAALVLRGTVLPHTRFAELLRLIIQTREIASIPQGLDEVTVGAANRIRTEAPKVVFLLGAAQGEFPLTPGSVCVFSDSERRELIALGLPLNDTVEGMAVQERFLAYSVMGAASHRLYLSWPACGAGGEAKLPSSVITEARASLRDVPAYAELSLGEDYFANAAVPAFELASRTWRRGTPFSATLRAFFDAREQDRPRLYALARAADRPPAAFAEHGNAQRLFGKDMLLSATQIEAYHLCRFQYFCRYGMNAKERRAAELDALEYGSLMHYLMEHLFRDTGAQALDEMEPEALRTLLLSLLDTYLESKLGGRQSKTPRFAYLFERLADAALVIVQHTARELCQSAFVPRFFEYPIGGEGQPQLVLPLPDGGSVRIGGKVDRVDIMECGSEKYLRVVDYKTGKKEFKLADVLYGINLQMLVYLAALSQEGVRPAGVLYVPSSPPLVSLPRGTDEEKVQAETDKKLRMHGFVLEDEEVLRGMEPSGEGRYSPVALKDGVPAKRDNVVSGSELRHMMEYGERLICEMAQQLREGHIEAVPLTGGYDACAWCPYSAVCGHEETDPVRETQKWDRQELFGQFAGNTERGNEA